MEKAHKQVLVKNRLELVRNVIVDEELFSVLRVDNIITDDMQQNIESQKTSQGKVGRLLDILPRRGKRAFARFVKALKETRQEHVVSILQADIPEPVDKLDITDDPNDPDWMINIEEHVTKINAAGSTSPGEMNITVKRMNETLKTKLKQDEGVYQIQQKMLAVIINNYHFHQFSLREGSEYDMKNLENLFKQLNFEVLVHEDKTAAETRVILDSVQSKLKTGQYDLFVFVIMSHGTQGGIVYGRDEKELNIYGDVLSRFNDKNCPEMIGKPRIIFIQACQGDTASAGVPANIPQSDLKADDKSKDADGDRLDVKWNNPDIMLVFATAQGFKAWRNTERGSWFIRSIVYVFEKRAYKDHVIDLMTQVTNFVSYFKANNICIQIAERIDTLTKQLYFTM